MSSPYMTSFPSRRTNGLAIASFVLSLAWLGGLGSVLAVIFGATASRDIARSQGTQSGNGLAVAGLVIGILGLLGSAVFWFGLVVLGAGVHQGLHQALTPHTVSVQAGQAVTLSPADGGIKEVTVFSVVHPIPAPSAFTTPDPGNEFAVADIQLCAGQDGSPRGMEVLPFQLVLAGGTEVSVSFHDAKVPALTHLGAIGANACARGFLTFVIPTGATPAKVTYYAPELSRTYEWNLVA